MTYQVLFASILLVSSASADLLVDLPDGTIRGSEITIGNINYNAYRGIPFATPPLGTLRFQAPVPNEPWSGILEATESKDCCISMGDATDEPQQSEDCLYINVYTPARNISEKLPVLFWIYGGGFTVGCGSDSIFEPSPLVKEDVIVVTFNYRLGVYGFLSTQDNVILGNAGLKDQLLAMKWTQRNIEYFGGDPNKVTIIGESAGGVSVGAHLANKKSAGLYRAAICQSGCSLSNLPTLSQTNPKQNAYNIAKVINPFVSENSQDIKVFLQSLPDSMLTSAFNTANSETGLVVEVEDENAYVTDLSFDLIESGNFNQVPLIIGTTSEESLTFGIPVLLIASIVYDINPSAAIPSNLNPLPGTDLNEVGTLIKKAYTDGLFALNLSAFQEYLSDNLFVRSSLKQAELQSKYSPVYFYQFSYSGLESPGKVGHTGDVRYLFNMTEFPLSTIGELITRDRMTRLWANFAKTLNPTPDLWDPLLNVIWPQVSGTNIPYLDIDQTLEVKPGKKAKEMEMWNNVFYTYGQQPFNGF